jgi:hypothetical protein
VVAVTMLLSASQMSAAAERTPAAAAAAAWTEVPIGSLDRGVFTLALRAATCALRSGAVDRLETLTIIDYSKPSTEKRLWVFDVTQRALLYEELVAHGSGSGGNLARRFSNDEGTHTSSLGLFATRDTYVGRNGYSLRLDGLDAGFNDRARERAIVMHGAPYVSADFAKAQGRLGRSWGCPALRPEVTRDLIDRVKESGLLFAYYPDPQWLQLSDFLNSCSTAVSSS